MSNRDSKDSIPIRCYLRHWVNIVPRQSAKVAAGRFDTRRGHPIHRAEETKLLYSVNIPVYYCPVQLFVLFYIWDLASLYTSTPPITQPTQLARALGLGVEKLDRFT